MNKKTSIALFLATTSVVALTSTGSSSLKAEESDLGGLKAVSYTHLRAHET